MSRAHTEKCGCKSNEREWLAMCETHRAEWRARHEQPRPGATAYPTGASLPDEPRESWE
jgi:hypothetical protein